MKKLKSLAIGVVFVGTALCVAPAIGVLPVANSAVFADDGAITVEEGDSFEVYATLASDTYKVELSNTDAELSLLSQNITVGEEDGTYTLYVLAVINTPGEHELLIKDGDGNVVKSVSVNVTEVPDPDDGSSSEDSGDGGDTGEENGDGDTDVDNSDDSQGNTENSADQDVELVGFLSVVGGKISGTTESGELKSGETITLKAEPEKGYVLRSWVVRSLDGRVVAQSPEAAGRTYDFKISEDGTFTIPDYPIRISAEFEYNLIHEIELLDVTEKLEVGKPVTFTGHVKDNTDSRFFLLDEEWTNEYDTTGISSSKKINDKNREDGLALLEKVLAGDKYNYSVRFGTTPGYEFADDVKLLYNGKEYTPTEDGYADGKTKVVFSGFLSFGEQTNPKETKTVTKTVTKQETRKETVTQYVYNTYTYTTYQYVTKYVTTPRTVLTTTGGTVRTIAAATGDKNNAGVWIALAIAAGGGVVSGILVGRRRKRNK